MKKSYYLDIMFVLLWVAIIMIGMIVGLLIRDRTDGAWYLDNQPKPGKIVIEKIGDGIRSYHTRYKPDRETEKRLESIAGVRNAWITHYKTDIFINRPCCGNISRFKAL